MSVVKAVQREVKELGPRAEKSAMAATALALAGELDGDSSATSKSMCAKSLVDVMRELRVLAPARKEKDGLDVLAARRTARRSRGAAPKSSARS